MKNVEVTAKYVAGDFGTVTAFLCTQWASQLQPICEGTCGLSPTEPEHRGWGIMKLLASEAQSFKGVVQKVQTEVFATCERPRK